VASRKTYGQFCGLARTLDRVGDRWTLLVIRELLLRDAPFRELQTVLPGIAPNLLADRLHDLVADGIIERSKAPQRSKAVRYALSPLGRSLEPAVLELIRWGATWLTSGPGTDHVDPAWGALALRALLTTTSITTPRGVLHVDIDGVDLTISVSRHGRTVTPGRPAPARARVTAALPPLLALASGKAPVDPSRLTITGDVPFARSVLGLADR
jgi:DNA-binding HxlR family transcriptional regulator